MLKHCINIYVIKKFALRMVLYAHHARKSATNLVTLNIYLIVAVIYSETFLCNYCYKPETLY